MFQELSTFRLSPSDKLKFGVSEPRFLSSSRQCRIAPFLTLLLNIDFVRLPALHASKRNNVVFNVAMLEQRDDGRRWTRVPTASTHCSLEELHYACMKLPRTKVANVVHGLVSRAPRQPPGAQPENAGKTARDANGDLLPKTTRPACQRPPNAKVRHGKKRDGYALCPAPNPRLRVPTTESNVRQDRILAKLG